MIDVIDLHLEAQKDTSIENLAQQQTELTYKYILVCIDNGAAWLTKKGSTKRIYDAALTIRKGETLHIYCNEFTLQPCPYVPELVQDETLFSVWKKPSGMFSQGSKFGTHWTIHRWIEQHHFKDRTSFITHRLDRFTEGLMLIAHDAKVNYQLHRLFESRQVKKTYRALVKGIFPTGEVVEVNSQINKQDASSVVTGLKNDREKNLSLVEIEPKTGRKHQIRRHLSYMGHPVINDRQYGETPYLGDLMLQASRIEFVTELNETTGKSSYCYELPEQSLLTLESI